MEIQLLFDFARQRIDHRMFAAITDGKHDFVVDKNRVGIVGKLAFGPQQASIVGSDRNDIHSRLSLNDERVGCGNDQRLGSPAGRRCESLARLFDQTEDFLLTVGPDHFAGLRIEAAEMPIGTIQIKLAVTNGQTT